MAEFILIQTLLNLFLAILWNSDTMSNVVCKMIVSCMAAYGAYLLFGPANRIASLSH